MNGRLWLGLAILVTGCWPRALGASDFYFDSRGVVRSFAVLDDRDPSRPVVSYDGGPALQLVGRLGVGFAAQASQAQRVELLEDVGAAIVRRYARAPDFVVVELEPGAQVFSVSQTLTLSPLVRFAEPIARMPVELHAAPNDPVFLADVQLHLRDDIHGFVSAWDTTVGDPHVVVAVLDTGVDFSHPELSEAVVGGFDVLSAQGAGLPEIGFDEDYHGTAVAGLIAAATNNGQGIAGMCWDCALYAVRLIDSNATLYTDQENIFDAFDAAVGAGAWILNNSWGPYGMDEAGECVATPFGDIVAEAVALAETTGRSGRGSLVVWSAGNEGCPTSLQPHLGVPESVVVAALDGLLALQPYSNRGYEVDVCAVEGNFTTDLTGKAGASDGSDAFLSKFEGLEAADYLRNFRGTSAAAPVASGALALILSVNPNLTAEQARQCLYAASSPVDSPCEDGPVQAGRSPCFGRGRFDVSIAVDKARSGECGGLCEVDEDCVAGTRCGISGLCAFGPRPEDTDTGTGSDSDSPGLDSDSESASDDTGNESDDESRPGGCGCSVVGA